MNDMDGEGEYQVGQSMRFGMFDESLSSKAVAHDLATMLTPSQSIHTFHGLTLHQSLLAENSVEMTHR